MNIKEMCPVYLLIALIISCATTGTYALEGGDCVTQCTNRCVSKGQCKKPEKKNECAKECKKKCIKKCPPSTNSPTISTAPSTTSSPSVMPSVACTSGYDDKFKIDMNPDPSLHTHRKFIRLVVQKRKTVQEDSEFNDETFALRVRRFAIKPSTVAQCFTVLKCYKAVIYSHYDADIGIGNGTFEAHWNGK